MKKRNIAKIAGVGAVLGGAAFAIGSNYFFNLALSTKTSKDKVFGPSDESLSIEETSGLLTKEDLEWFKSQSEKKSVYILSEDNVKLHGYKIMQDDANHKWVIIVHGYMSSAIYMSRMAKNFYEMGYNIIMVDLRAHGKSEGEYIGMGWPDRLDIIAWIDYLVKMDKDSEIVLHGVSMGAGTVMMTAGEEMPSNVKAIIEDCGYTSAWAEFKYQLKSLYKLPSFPLMNGADVISKLKAGYSMKEASALNQVAKSITPILFIHGDKDEFVPYEMMAELYNTATCEKAMVTIEGAAHATSAMTNPELYWSSIKTFLEKYIK